MNNLCPFKHNHVSEEPEIIDVEDTETENFTTEENQCHICRMKLQTKDLFYNHVEIEHVEYFKGMTSGVSSAHGLAWLANVFLPILYPYMNI